MLRKKWVSTISLLVSIGFCFFSGTLFAAQDQTIGSLASHLKSDISVVAQLLIVISYIAGVGFALAGIMQFKAHKDNPTQVPLSKPMVYLIVGACLLFLPTVILTAGETLFGSSKQAGDTSVTSDIKFGQ